MARKEATARKLTAEERDDALQLVEDIQQTRAGAVLGKPDREQIPYILLPSQVRWHQDGAVVRIGEKARRVGFSWGCWACEAVLEAARPPGRGMDQFYMGYNQAMAAEFIGDCSMWARWFGTATERIAVGVESVIIDNERRDVLKYSIKFASGHQIVALSSAPHNWRGHQGHARIDEAAFQHDLAEVVKGALAFRLWGGRISIGSTHHGEENYFNTLIKDVVAGRLPWSHHKITFDDALAEGLFKRICLITKKTWSPEAETKFRADAYADYPLVEMADEELGVIPMRGVGAYFSRLLYEKCQADRPLLRLARPPQFVTDPGRIANIQSWIDESLAPLIAAMPKRRTVFGQDFGRSGDLSVVWVLQEDGARWDTAFVLELRQIPFDCQRLILDYLLPALPDLVRAKFDARGNGQSHAEHALQQLGPQRVDCVMSTGAWYDEHFPLYRQAFEGETIVVPAHPDLLDDHLSVVLVNGSPRISNSRKKGSDGHMRHADSAVAGVLAWAATRTPGYAPAGLELDAPPDTYTPSGFARTRAGFFTRDPAADPAGFWGRRRTDAPSSATATPERGLQGLPRVATNESEA